MRRRKNNTKAFGNLETLGGGALTATEHAQSMFSGKKKIELSMLSGGRPFQYFLKPQVIQLAKQAVTHRLKCSKIALGFHGPFF